MGRERERGGAPRADNRRGLSRAKMAEFKYHQYQVVGRHLPTESDPSPSLFRMKVWAVDEVCARSKFWYFIKRIKRVKKANGQIIAVNEIFEKDPTTVKNYGVWLRVMSRTGYYNMYKEFRDVTMNGAIDHVPGLGCPPQNQSLLHPDYQDRSLGRRGVQETKHHSVPQGEPFLPTPNQDQEGF